MAHDLPPLRLLSAFAAVSDTGSIQSAAAELNVTQPAISQAVKQLEAFCGLRLLDRGHRPARPTEAGRALADAIEEGFGCIEETLASLRLAEQEGMHAVAVACSVGVATYWLMPRLSAFYETHPEISVNVITTRLGAPDLSGGVGLAIRYGHGRWRDGTVSHLFGEVVEPLCSPALRRRFAGTMPLDAVPLDAVPLLHVRAPEPSWVTWDDYFRATGQRPAAARGRTFTNYVQATQAAVEGLGMMLGWQSITGGLVAGGQLVPAGHPRHRPNDAFYLVARPKRIDPAADTFAAWLHASAKTGV